jgi:hypothetical protein
MDSPINCVLCRWIKVREGLFVCGAADDKVLDETPKPKWCPIDAEISKMEDNHRYLIACACGYLDV